MRREPTPLDDTLAELNATEQAIQEWKDLRSTPAFQRLTAFMSAEFVNLGMQDCNTLAELKGRNMTMRWIRDVFAFMCYDSHEKDRLLHELKMLEPEDE